MGIILDAVSVVILTGTSFGCSSSPGVPPAHAGVAPSGPFPDIPHDAASVDFTKLRTEIGDRTDFSERCEDNRPLNEFGGLVEAERWVDLRDICKPWLEKCPIDIDAHFLTGLAASKLGETELAKHHFAWHRGLVKSILASGDGRSPKTAFLVVSVPEEYALLRSLGLRPKSQSLVGDTIDELTAEGKSGEVTLFFNVPAHFRRLARRFGLGQ